MKSLFTKGHAVNFQDAGRHAMEQNQVVEEGDNVDDGFLVVNPSQQALLKLVAIPVLPIKPPSQSITTSVSEIEIEAPQSPL